MKKGSEFPLSRLVLVLEIPTVAQKPALTSFETDTAALHYVLIG